MFAALTKAGPSRKQIPKVLLWVIKASWLHKVRLSERVFEVSRALVLALQFVKTAHHVIVEHVVVPDRDHERKGREEQTLNAANVGNEIQNLVSLTLVFNRVHQNFDGEVKLSIVVLFIRSTWESLKRKNAVILFFGK